MEAFKYLITVLSLQIANIVFFVTAMTAATTVDKPHEYNSEKGIVLAYYISKYHYEEQILPEAEDYLFID